MPWVCLFVVAVHSLGDCILLGGSDFSVRMGSYPVVGLAFGV